MSKIQFSIDVSSSLTVRKDSTKKVTLWFPQGAEVLISSVFLGILALYIWSMLGLITLIAKLNSVLLELVHLPSSWLWVSDQMTIPDFEILA